MSDEMPIDKLKRNLKAAEEFSQGKMSLEPHEVKVSMPMNIWIDWVCDKPAVFSNEPENNQTTTTIRYKRVIRREEYEKE